jgi:hypothetical protein
VFAAVVLAGAAGAGAAVEGADAAGGGGAGAGAEAAGAAGAGDATGGVFGPQPTTTRPAASVAKTNDLMIRAPLSE